ncbi:MAG: DUF3500 domain-containing protein, partial [Chitinophagaceae bacterium]|nr:DUF3500 domain-containing protein [Chitinophagaceae bacterium]
PVIVISDKATINPASQTTQNFTNPVSYTVTAEDNSTALYTSTITKNTGNTNENTDCNTATGITKIICLTDAFKSTLSASQISTVQLEYNATNAAKWSNLPNGLYNGRLGIRLGDLNSTQLSSAKALIKEVTGSITNEGFDEIQQLWAADDYLGANGGGSTYSAGQFFIAFLGTPSTTGIWELQTGGHHLAVANTYKNGELTGATPSFRAVEPFAPFGDKSYAPILQERDALAAILSSLSTSELASAKLSSTFTDILLGPGKDKQFPSTKVGLKVNTLNNTQKNTILNAIKTYVYDVNDTQASVILAKYERELDETFIAYSGNASLTIQNDYIRIDGPSVWIEYSVQGGIVIRGTPHPHSIWRDHLTDYGANF